MNTDDAIDCIVRAGREPGIAIQRGERLDTDFSLSVGDRTWLFQIREGRITTAQPGPLVMPSVDFELAASSAQWHTFWQPVPPPGSHDLFALLRRGTLDLRGNLHPFMSHLFYFKFLLSAPRAANTTEN